MIFQKALDVFYMWPERGEEWGLGKGRRVCGKSHLWLNLVMS